MSVQCDTATRKYKIQIAVLRAEIAQITAHTKRRKKTNASVLIAQKLNQIDTLIPSAYQEIPPQQ